MDAACCELSLTHNINNEGMPIWQACILLGCTFVQWIIVLAKFTIGILLVNKLSMKVHQFGRHTFSLDAHSCNGISAVSYDLCISNLSWINHLKRCTNLADTHSSQMYIHAMEYWQLVMPVHMLTCPE